MSLTTPRAPYEGERESNVPRVVSGWFDGPTTGYFVGSTMGGTVSAVSSGQWVRRWVRNGALGLLIAVVVLSPAAVAGSNAASHAAPASAPSGHLFVAPPTGTTPAVKSTSPSTGAGSLGAGPSSPSSSLPKVAAFPYPGAHPPRAWGGNPFPPGAPQPMAPHPSDSWGSSSEYPQTLLNHCDGVWPDGGQQQYIPNCYGHDEPGLDPYSTLPGSGGNVTWNVTLPVDRSHSQNQSDLYSAIWFGMTLSNPLGANSQCFLELQFYPDQSFYTGPGVTQDGNWIGAAVAWQLDLPYGGTEDPCFYSPLFLDGSAGSYYNMTEGDVLNVTMTGWIGDPYGENITIQDLTQNTSSSLTLYDFQGGYPLDPAYATSSFPNSLQWTPGGELPVSFAFETGHVGNNEWPSNSTYGGCSPGVPPPTPTNPAVPCPSYDTSSWANDTLHPWVIHAPTFFNAGTRQTAAQVGFTQDLGGVAWIQDYSIFGAPDYGCEASLGSAWCTYPWYSYDCTQQAYNFGATDYSGTTYDFGKYNQYQSVPTRNAYGAFYYSPTPFTVPTCGGTSATVTVTTVGVGSGTVQFLGTNGAGPTVVGSVAHGQYSLAATPAAGSVFAGWAATGGLSVASGDGSNPWTTLTVGGSGTLTATFSLIATTTSITFATSGGPAGNISIVPGFADPTFGLLGEASTTAASGTTLSLNEGVYSILALPPIGYNFTVWTSTAGVTIADPTGPFTWLVVSGTTATVTANFVPSVGLATLEVVWTGDGTVAVNGTVLTGPGFNISTFPVGSYTITTTVGPLSTFGGINYGGGMLFANFSTSSPFYIPEGFSEAIVLISTAVPVTLYSGPAPGAIAVSGEGAWSNATTVVLPLGPDGLPNTFPVAALPGAGASFGGWTTSDPTNATLDQPAAALATLNISSAIGAPLSLFALFTASGTTTVVTFDTNLAAGGNITVDNLTVPNGTALGLGAGMHIVAGVPNASYQLASIFLGGLPPGWAPVVGPDAMAFNLSAGSATIWVNFSAIPPPPPLMFAVTFASTTPGGALLTINGTTIGPGESVMLAPGAYTINGVAGTGSTFQYWNTSPSIAVVGANNTINSAVLLTGPGTIIEIGSIPAGAVLTGVSLTPQSVLVAPGTGVSLTASITCLGAACPAGASISWTATGGTFNTTSGSAVTYTPPNAAGVAMVWASATLNGITLESFPTSVALPALVSETLAPTTFTVVSGATQSLGATVGCQNGLTCPAGTTFTWAVVTPGLGTLSATTGASVTFTGGGNWANGTVNVTAQLGGVSIVDVANVSVTVPTPILTGVAVTATTALIAPGGSGSFSAAIACTANRACPAGTTYTWTLTPTTLGTLTPNGASATLAAGSAPGFGNVSVTATLNSVTVASLSTAVFVPQALTAVALTVSAASVTVGGASSLSALLSCSGSCPAGATISWSVVPSSLGTLSATTGATVTFTAGNTPGSVNVTATATLPTQSFHGKSYTSTLASSASEVTVKSATPSSNSTPLTSNPLLWVVIAVIVIAIIAIAILAMRRRPKAPATDSAAPAATPDSPKMPEN